MAMTMVNEAQTAPADLSVLSLDVALQLDRLSNHKSANLSLIGEFGRRLGSPSSLPGSSSLFCLQENPVNVDILNSALHSIDGSNLENMDELEAKIRDLISKLNDVAAGHTTEARIISNLKRFCLSLHRVLLDELSPAVDHDEWMPVQNVRFA
jgi:hypothetical protein